MTFSACRSQFLRAESSDRPCPGAARLLLTLLLIGLLTPVYVEAQVSRWVDADGVTHFTDQQFAPAGATQLDIQPANGMLPTSYSSTARAQPVSQGPNVSVISIEPKRNVKGWRPRRESIYTGRKHTSRGR